MSSSPPPRFLRATAQNRVVLSYAVSPRRVAPLLPDGLVPVQRDGMAHVSLACVELTKVRVLGLPSPSVRRMPVVELRVHVRRAAASSTKRGTWTVRTHVPRRLVAWGARLLYGEPVYVTSMQAMRREQVEHVEVTYRFDWKGREQRIRVRGTRPPVMPAPDTLASSFLGSTWRFGTTRDGSLRRTRIERPAAPIYRVEEHHVTVQWPSIYGEIGQLLTDRQPIVVLLSPGMPVTLRWRERV